MPRPIQFTKATRSHWFLHLFPLYFKIIPHNPCHIGLTCVTRGHYTPWQYRSHQASSRKGIIYLKDLCLLACFVWCCFIIAKSQQLLKQFIKECKTAALSKCKKNERGKTCTTGMINLLSSFYTSAFLMHNLYVFTGIYKKIKQKVLLERRQSIINHWQKEFSKIWCSVI